MLFFKYAKNFLIMNEFYSNYFYLDVINTITSHNTLLNLTRLIHLKCFFTKFNKIPMVSVNYNICVSRTKSVPFRFSYFGNLLQHFECVQESMRLFVIFVWRLLYQNPSPYSFFLQSSDFIFKFFPLIKHILNGSNEVNISS